MPAFRREARGLEVQGQLRLQSQCDASLGYLKIQSVFGGGGLYWNSLTIQKCHSDPVKVADGAQKERVTSI